MAGQPPSDGTAPAASGRLAKAESALERANTMSNEAFVEELMRPR